MRNDIEYRHLLDKCRDARDRGLSALSNAERIAAALALNRPEWLTQLDCTMAEAIDQIGLIRCSMLLQVQRDLVGQPGAEPRDAGEPREACALGNAETAGQAFQGFVITDPA
jgi:hypothetical protein